MHAPPGRMRELWALWNGQAIVGGTAQWRLRDIEAGIPSIRPATADQFVPQMLNLDHLGGISFTKGCYPGQEIVARLHYLGNLKRRMVRGMSTSAAPVGTALFAEGAAVVGEVVDAAENENGTWMFLAVVQEPHANDGQLSLGRAGGAPATMVQRS